MPVPKEIAASLAAAEEKLAAARALLSAGFSADAASRAYYCAFHAICAVLWSRNLTFSTHGQTIGAFNREFVKQGLFPKHYSRRLAKMQADREAGDYRTRSPIEAQIAAEDVQFADEILSACRKYIGSLYGDTDDVSASPLS